ncbi:hypothetical protein [Ruegeria atlantica]|uniref:hypothetical protein n=1 Tax=Ruegeria atlantica TaxID=81569 RepID=UPI0024949DF0|nr:hypothetical protein [Ruegeria atlantica]
MTRAETVLKTAKAVTEGDPKTLAEMAQPDGKSIAARLFGRAFVALRAKAREEARQEAQAEVQKHFGEIKARRSLVGHITMLKRAIKKWHQTGQNKDPEV